MLGTGVYSRAGKSLLHLLAEVATIDCKSAKVLKTKDLALSEVIPDEFARTPFANWTPETERFFRDAVAALPVRAWEVVLKDVELNR